MTSRVGPLVVVTGAAGAGRTELAQPLAGRLGCVCLSLEEIADELSLGAEDTPREWLQLDAEAELVRRLEAFGGEAVVDLWISLRNGDRVRRLLRPWWEKVIEVRCHLPGAAVEPSGSLGAARTVLVDTSRPVALDDVVVACRRETGARPLRRTN